MMESSISFKGCPICSNPTKEVTDQNFKVTCKNCGTFEITANAINDWLLNTVPEFKRSIATKYIHNHKDELIKSEDILKFSS